MPRVQARWVDLVTLLLGIAFTLPLAAWAARKRTSKRCLLGTVELLCAGQVRPGFLVFIVLSTSSATRSPAR